MHDPNNEILDHMNVGELVYFIEEGKNGRIKVQRNNLEKGVQKYDVGWCSWKTGDGCQIMAVHAREV